MKHPLSAYREDRNLTLEAFGNLVGVTKSAVLKWESGATPRRKTLLQIAVVTDGRLTANDFLGYSQPEAA